MPYGKKNSVVFITTVFIFVFYLLIYFIIKRNKIIKEDILKVLPSSKNKAMTVQEITSKLSGKHPTMHAWLVRKFIKILRLEWEPILWCHRGSYITRDVNEIERHQETIENMIAWFSIGMNRIKGALEKAK